MKFFGSTTEYALFDHKKKEEILEEFKVRVEAVDERLVSQLRLTATCNKNEQLDASAAL